MDTTHLFSVTKAFDRMPRAHAQFQDCNADGSPGPCANLHGYDLIVSIEVSAKELDQYGWVYGFGNFKKIRQFLEYYCDHTSAISAEDPRRKRVLEELSSGNSLYGTMRLMPYGVSMEMMSLFLLEQTAGYIYNTSEGRCAITKIEFREHSANQGQLVIDFDKSLEIGKRLSDKPTLNSNPIWDFERPASAVKRILGE
jgi:6-pyruvoyl-tetrahydropterin synthase